MNVHSYNNDIEGGISMNYQNISDKTIDEMETLLNVTSDFTRLKILISLLDDHECDHIKNNHGELCTYECMVERCVNEIVNIVGASQSLISHQLKVLKNHKLVASRKEGKRVYYSLADGHIKMLLHVVYEHVMEEKGHDTESL